MARRRCALQVNLLESRAVGFCDPFLDFDYPQPTFSNQVTFVDDEDYNPVPIVAAPPDAPGVPQANGISSSEVDLKWVQPASSVPITFCTIKIRPVLPTKGDREREFEVETPAQIGWAETVVEGLLDGRSYTFQVKSRNLEGYGDWSMPSDIAVPLDPNRFHFPLEVHIGSRLSSIRLGEVKVAKETTLEEARHIIFDKMGAVKDGIRKDLSGVDYLSHEPLQQRWPVELVAPHSFSFTSGDCDRRTVTIPKAKERILRALDFQPKGSQILDEDQDGTFDFNQKLYLQPLRKPAQHQLPNVQNVEIHVRRPVFVVDNVEISDEGEAVLKSRSGGGRQPTVEGLKHHWDNNHVVIGVQTVQST